MARAYTQAARRRAKKGRSGQTVASLYQSFERQTVRQKPREDADRTVIEARQRHTGKSRDEVRKAQYGDICGKAIGMGSDSADESDRLWQTFKGLTVAAEIYYRRRIGVSLFPNVAKMEYMPEEWGTRPDDRPDTRTREEKEADARNTWSRWQGYLAKLSPSERTIIDFAMRHRFILFQMGKLTRHGQRFVNAMRSLDEVVRA